MYSQQTGAHCMGQLSVTVHFEVAWRIRRVHLEILSCYKSAND